MEAHAARALADGLDDDRRDLVAVPLDGVGQVGDVRRIGRRLEPVGRRVREHLARQDAGPQGVHPPLGVAERHRAQRVAVVAPAPGEQPVAPRAPAPALVLEAHLHRHLHRHRPGVGEEDVLQRIRRHLHQPPGQADGRLVREAAEHHVAHATDLDHGGGVERRVPVAVDGRPPGRHPVDQLIPAVDRLRQPQAHPGGRLHHEWLVAAGHRRVWMPDVAAVEREDLARVHPAVSAVVRPEGTIGRPRSCARRTSSAAGRPAVVR